MKSVQCAVCHIAHHSQSLWCTRARVDLPGIVVVKSVRATETEVGGWGVSAEEEGGVADSIAAGRVVIKMQSCWFSGTYT